MKANVPSHPSRMLKMFHPNLFVLCLSLLAIDSAVCLGFAAEGDEVLKPHLWTALNRTALKPQGVRTGPNLRENKLRHNSALVAEDKHSSESESIQNGSGTKKEERVEQLMEESDREVLETQHTTCRITTEELVSTAQATVTRVMKGLCNSREMEDRFHNLETQLTEQLNVIKTLLLNIEDKIMEQDVASRRARKRIMGTIFRQCRSASVTHESYRNGRTGSTTFEQEEDAGGTTWEDEESSDEISESPRDAEVNRYNSSIHAEPFPGQPYSSARSHVFTYYWRIQDMEYKLTGWNHRRSLRSPSFYTSPSGYRMYIRIYPRQNEENVYMHVGVTRGDFDDSLPWPFKLKHRVSVLDQVSFEDGQEDISSRVWDPTVLCSGFNWQKPTSGDNYECVGLGFAHSVIRSRHYIRDDAIIIKLSVYLG